MLQITDNPKIFREKAKFDNVIICGANKISLIFLHMAQKTDIRVRAVVENVHSQRCFCIEGIVVPIITMSEALSYSDEGNYYSFLIFSDQKDRYIKEMNQVFQEKDGIVLQPNENNNFNKMFEICRYELIKNKNLTIISNNCAAGLIYSNCGLKFNSPTINTLIYGDDFVKFCKNLSYYLSQEIKYVISAHRSTTKNIYPVGQLSDIYIHFVHEKEWNNCLDNWNKRVKRIQEDNLFFIFDDAQYNIKFKNAKEFADIEYEHKLITQRKSGYSLNYSILSEYNFCSNILYEEWIDIVGWLNGEEYVFS